MSTIAITGANVGLGFECAIQLAAEPTTSKVIIMTRSRAKCDTAIASLTKETGKPASFFDSAVVDLADMASIKRVSTATQFQ